ncbi:uncharacterized protein CANTADRAFT_6733 [Suhomyces tanzawaensis NRRL Y-17324]|uniref:DNA mismatch repair protein HSM3 N-terminal domain-containing protein n=1 Tax=Suhomyces tanzawaensis NRRL Y-17324 TaxID=984487 RepID=A0A1E4SFQ0_9ASCO|nr:uncharacterized protein CANTADRAFT_6733 [Suhomyces tanzawaensis NRRL Y-17324]ODV78338.1 hypothetical protein CANTADRAFT_6733 [Suhomyces tanzawaensis NRRL Y-17324]
MDPQSQAVLEHLQHVQESPIPVNANLVDSYIPSITPSTVSPAYLQSFIPAINQVLYSKDYASVDPGSYVLQLLQRILSLLSFSQILDYYPPEFILESIASPDNVQALKLCLEIILLKYSEAETTTFLVKNNLLHLLVQQYLTNKSLDIAIVSQIESLVQSIVLDDTPLRAILAEPDFDLLYNQIRFKDIDTTLLARLLDYLLLLLPYVPGLNPQLYNFTYEELVDIGNEDPLFSVIVVLFYLNVLKEILRNELSKVYQTIKPTLTELTKLYNSEAEDFTKSEIISVLAQLSYMYPKDAAELLEGSQILKTYNLIKVYEYHELDIKLLSTLNPEVIVRVNESIYDDVLDGLSLLNNNKYLSILLNFIKCKSIFERFTSVYFQNALLSRLSIDKLLTIILEFSFHPHSKSYLFNNLPNIINNVLIDESGTRFGN